MRLHLPYSKTLIVVRERTCGYILLLCIWKLNVEMSGFSDTVS